MQWAGDSWADGYCDGDPFLRVLFDNEEIPNRKKIAISSDKTTVVATYHEGPTGHLEFCAEPVDWTEEDKMLFTGKDDGKHMTFTIEAWGGVNTYVFSALRRLITRSSRRRRDVEEGNTACKPLGTENSQSDDFVSRRHLPSCWMDGISFLSRYSRRVIFNNLWSAFCSGYLQRDRIQSLKWGNRNRRQNRWIRCSGQRAVAGGYSKNCHRRLDSQRLLSSSRGNSKGSILLFLTFSSSESTNRLIHAM